MRLRNYTPHPVTIEGIGTLPSEGVARVEEKRQESILAGSLLRFTAVTYGEVVGLPENFLESGDVYIVSRPVAERLHLPCVVAPDGYVRDEAGNVTGCAGVAWFPEC